MRIMSANIRYSGAQDGDNDWELRKKFCAKLIIKNNPDIIGFQELCDNQFDYMNQVLSDYDSYGIFNGTININPLNRIYYKRSKFTFLTASAFYLSETPHIPESKSWDNSDCCPRFANWVILKEKATDLEFRFINTHLDHTGEIARINQARVISENTTAYPDEFPQFLSGDMNCDATNPAIQTYLKNGWRDTYHECHKTLTPGLTYHAFQGNNFAGDNITPAEVDKMDWLFYRGNVTVKSAEILKDTNNGKHPSDHYFVTADVELN